MSNRTDPDRTCHVDFGTGTDMSVCVLATYDGGRVRFEILGAVAAVGLDVRGTTFRRRPSLCWRRALAALAALLFLLLAASVAAGAEVDDLVMYAREAGLQDPLREDLMVIHTDPNGREVRRTYLQVTVPLRVWVLRHPQTIDEDGRRFLELGSVYDVAVVRDDPA